MKKISLTVIVIVLAVLSFWAGGWYVKNMGGGSVAQLDRKVLYYVDPMNPGFRSEKPGIAPCGMPLEPVYADADKQEASSAHGLSSGTVKVSLARQQLIGVDVNPVEVKPMTYTLRLYGKIVADETNIYRLNASTDSWIRELSDATTGSIVEKGAILAEALAPAFFNAQVTYLIALDNLDRIKRQLGGELRHQQADLADNQIRVAVQALQNLGITDAQIEELANTREAQPLLQVRAPVRGVVLNRNISLHQWFKAGEEFYSIADIGRVWVYADVYEDEAQHLRPGMTVQVRHKQLGRTFKARVSEVLPLFDSISKTLKVRIDVDNLRYDLRPDMFVDVEMPITLPPSLHVLADAVIDSGTTKIVYVEIGNSTFEPRRVETGWRLGRQIEITGGLMPGEKVLVSGNFLIDSESRMKTAAAGTQNSAARKDPVCGMPVDEEEAENSGKTFEYANETFYFCSDWCKETFEKEPEKYVRKIKINEKEKDHSMSGKDLSWADMLKPVKANQKNYNDHSLSAKKANDSTLTTSSPGVVDWDGAENGASQRDWSGWGKFPGAKYLGLKAKTPKKIQQRHDVAREQGRTVPEDKNVHTAENSAPASEAHHSDMKDEIRELPASGNRMQQDPVCNMQVDEKEAQTAVYANETFYFCSEQCKEAFEKDPEKYVRKIKKEEPAN